MFFRTLFMTIIIPYKRDSPAGVVLTEESLTQT